MNIEEVPQNKCFIKFESYCNEEIQDLTNKLLKTKDFIDYCDYSKFAINKTKTQPIRYNGTIGIFKVTKIIKVKLTKEEFADFTRQVNEKLKTNSSDRFSKYCYYDLVTKAVIAKVNKPLLCTWYLNRYIDEPSDEPLFYVLDEVVTTLSSADKLRQKRIKDKEFNGRMIDAVFKTSIEAILNKYGLELSKCHWKGDNEYYISFKNDNAVRDFILSKLDETVGKEMHDLGIDIKWYKAWSKCGQDTTLAFSKNFKFNLKGGEGE